MEEFCMVSTQYMKVTLREKFPDKFPYVEKATLF